jgi:hypothetical protein
MRATFHITFCTLALVLACPDARGADKRDVDWPCIQRKLPTISAGMIWVGPAIGDGAAATWRTNEAVARLVPRLAARRTGLEEAEKLISDFASGLDQAMRSGQLTLLFAGVLESINSERRQIMAGIERYTRKQRALAGMVRKRRDELNEILKIDEPGKAEKEKRRELENQLAWQSRIHDEREQSLQFVCESPVLLEQRAFAIARAIMNHLQ